MAEITKQALKVDNNQSFPNNNNGAITPSILRAFNTNMIDSMVDEIGYTADSSSWNQQIDALEQFTASAAGLSTGSLLVTASAVSNVITFTKGNGSTFNVTVADTTDLSSLNAFTASATISLNNLNLWTSSYQPVIVNLQASQSIDNTKFNNIGTQSGSWDNTSLNSYTASNDTKWNTLGGQSGSWVTESETGSFARTDASNTFTQTNIFTSISASSFVSASAFVGDGSKITNITASISLPILDEGIPQGNAFSMNFTGSAISAIVVGGTAVVSVNAISTASLNTLTQSFNDYTASNDTKWNTLGGQTGSYVTSAITASSLVTASVNLNTITFTKGDASTFNITVNTGSGGGTTDITSLNAFTASQETKDTTLASVTSSLNSATASLFTSASLAIITASVTNDDITFTKGDGSTFTIQVATGSYAENAATSSITNNVVVIARNGGTSTLAAGTVVHITSASGDNPIFTTASFDTEALSSNTFGLLRYSSPAGVDVQVIVSGIVTGVNTDPALGYVAGDILYLSSSGQFTRIQPQAPNQIVTLGQVLRAQQNNGSIYVSINNGWELNELHNVQINTPLTGDLLQYESSSYGLWKNKSISGAGITTTSSFNTFTQSVDTKFNTLGGLTGSYATTGSNTFYGNQTLVSSSVILQGSGQLQLPNGFSIAGNAGDISQLAASNTIQFITEGAVGPGGTNDIKFINRVTGSKIIFENSQGGQGNGVEFTAGYVSFDIGVRSGSTGIVSFGSNTTAIEALSTPILAQRLELSGALTASLQQGYTWVGNASGITTLVATSSFGSGGNFATTGSNVFTGDQTLIDAAGNSVTLSDVSGSLMLVAKTFTSASAHISASAGNQVNLIFKNNNNTADTILSGSNNIFVNASAPTAGFKRYVGGSGNIYNGGTWTQISSSMQFSPVMNRNIGNSVFTMRGPVSSSTWTLNDNVIPGTVNIGGNATFPAERITAGLAFSSNYIAGIATIIANGPDNFNTLANFTGNIINGNPQFSLNSSSVVVNFNNINDNAFSLTNNFFSGSAGQGQLAFSRNNIGGQAQSVLAQGALPIGGTGAPSLSDNTMLGGNNIIFVDVANAPLTGSAPYHSAVRNIIGGHNLVVSGSSTLSHAQTLGSAFFGRFNANDGIRNKTAQNVFVVGTGTSATNTKTGFLIDSGSNTFVEGTLNVSGATSLNGELVITGSLTASLQQGYVWVGDASGKTVTVATSSFGGGGAAFPYTGDAVISGSLQVTGSFRGYVNTLSVTSNTASIDMVNGNFFTLDLPTSATTHIVVTNIKPGQTINLQVSQSSAATGSVAFAPNIKFAGGFDYTATPVTGALDLLSFVSFDTNQILATSVKNLL